MQVSYKQNACKKKAADLLISEEGIRYRDRRCIEPDAVFGQIKTIWHIVVAVIGEEQDCLGFFLHRNRI